MQAGTTTVATTTGSKTIADLLGRAAEQYGDRVAARHKADGAWHDVTFAQAGEIVREVGLGLIDLGIEPGERVSLLAKTRVEWTWCDFAVASAGAVVVPVYATNSAEECEWVAGNSESVAVICEDAAQVAKIVAVRERLPHLRTLVVIDPAGDTADAIALDEVRARGRTRDAAELDARAAAVTPEDTFTIIYHSPTRSRCSSSCCPSTSATRSRTSAGTRTGSSPSCRRSSRPICRASRGSSRRSTRSSWPPSRRPSRRR
jgi:long-chain acyl-CoA synthetase